MGRTGMLFYKGKMIARVSDVTVEPLEPTQIVALPKGLERYDLVLSGAAKAPGDDEEEAAEEEEMPAFPMCENPVEREHRALLAVLANDLRMQWPVAIANSSGRGINGATVLMTYNSMHAIEHPTNLADRDLRHRALGALGCHLCGEPHTGMHYMIQEPTEGPAQPSYVNCLVCDGCVEELRGNDSEFENERHELRAALTVLKMRQRQRAFAPRLREIP